MFKALVLWLCVAIVTLLVAILFVVSRKPDYQEFWAIADQYDKAADRLESYAKNLEEAASVHADLNLIHKTIGSLLWTLPDSEYDSFVKKASQKPFIGQGTDNFVPISQQLTTKRDQLDSLVLFSQFWLARSIALLETNEEEREKLKSDQKLLTWDKQVAALHNAAKQIRTRAEAK